jgi:endoribonuclease Dicer
MDYSIKAGELPTVDREPARMLGAVIVHGESLGTHVASSGGTARTRACAKALEVLEGVTVEEFRTRYHCDCRSEEQVKQAQ